MLFATMTVSRSRGLPTIPENRIQELGGTHSAVRPDPQRALLPARRQLGHLLRPDPHHRTAAGIEGHRRDEREACARSPLHRSLQLILGVQGLDPGDVRAAAAKTLGLLGESVERLGVRAFAERLQNVAGGANRSGHHNGTSRGGGGSAGYLRSRAVDCDDLVAQAVQSQPVVDWRRRCW